MLELKAMKCTEYKVLIEKKCFKKSFRNKKQWNTIMKLLLISDLHTTTDRRRLIDILTMTDYDVICLLGDNFESDLDIIIDHAKKVPILGVLGNHDMLTTYDDYPQIRHIDRRQTTVDGVTFVGVDGSLRYKDNPNIAMRTEKEFDEVVRGLQSANVLISHAGPLEAQYNIEFTTHHFVDYSNYYKKFQPNFHLFCHYHCNKAFTIKNNNKITKCLCVFGCVILDLEQEKYKILLNN